jgi:hypothetical protein
MRSILAGLVLATAAAPAVADDKCTKEVADAFAKQAQAPKMRTIMTHPGGEGTVTRTISLVRPNRMHAITEAPHEEAGRIETISIGKWAWGSDSDGGWSEHKPNIAKMIEMDVEKMSAAQTVGANFSCLGTVNVDGKDYIGYRADPGKGDDGVELAATIYVEPASGLPALNIVAPTAGGDARLKATYSYADDITVDPPAGFAEPKDQKSESAAPAPAEAPQKN